MSSQSVRAAPEDQAVMALRSRSRSPKGEESIWIKPAKVRMAVGNPIAAWLTEPERVAGEERAGGERAVDRGESRLGGGDAQPAQNLQPIQRPPFVCCNRRNVSFSFLDCLSACVPWRKLPPGRAVSLLNIDTDISTAATKQSALWPLIFAAGCGIIGGKAWEISLPTPPLVRPTRGLLASDASLARAAT